MIRIGDNRYRIPYSTEQANALCDSCLYGLPYGVEIGSDEYIIRYLKAHGVVAEQVAIGLDDAVYEFTVTVQK